MSSGLEEYINKKVSIITGDGRVIVGKLRGFDQTVNVVLSGSNERVFSSSSGVEEVPLGVYIIRGDNIAVIGELDEDLDSEINLEDIKAEPLNAIVH